ncbi:MAG: SDR family oxidoreductase [Betaproteobacteria bacterium]|nr:SDR family oxidoreductase [Betaproteobacteria bacterium]
MSAEHTSYWSGQAAVVTGGARGQGACVARLLVQAGATVHVMDALPAEDGAWTALRACMQGMPGRLLPVHADVSDEGAWEDLTAQVQAAGRPLLGLVNNAGITGPRAPVTQTTSEHWQRVMATNLTGSFLGIRTLAPLMPRGAAIVNVSSTVGMTGYFSAAYSSSKWALRGLTRSAAMELGPRGVRVNCICPGVVDTEMVRNYPALVETLQGIIALEHMARPEQLADVMFFLLGPQSSYITGADLAVDGGVIGTGIYWPVGRSLGVV